MPLCILMGYYLPFPIAIPLYKASFIRVTHPSAGRRHVLLHALPLDLHVLSLPLAFILSQDQTLHGMNFIPSLSTNSKMYVNVLSFLFTQINWGRKCTQLFVYSQNLFIRFFITC